jgi:hypothetical protein
MGGRPVHPNELYYYLYTEDITYNQKFNLPISSEIYPLLIMPLSAKDYIPEKYHGIMDNDLKDMYDTENCVECKKLLNTYKLTKSKIKTCQSERLAEKYSSMYRNQFDEYIEHKKIHTHKFCEADIKNIINLCTQI